MYKNTQTQGDAGLGQAIAYFTRFGCTVALPLTDSQDYDLIVEMQGELKKVQVKTGTKYNGNVPLIYCATSGGNKSGTGKVKTIQEQGWDFLYCHHLTENVSYLIPKDKITTKDQLCLGKKYKEFLV